MHVVLTAEAIEWLRAKRVFFEPGLRTFRLQPGDTLHFEDDLEIEPYCGILEGQIICKIGSFSYSRSPLSHGLTVGRYTSIGLNFNIPGPRHPLELLSTSSFVYDRESSLVQSFLSDSHLEEYRFYPNPQRPPPIIGNDIWIGNNVTVMPGTIIGDGSVIASNSVVVKSVAPYSVIGGNPAKVVRPRFDPASVDTLLAIKWWQYSFDVLQRFNLGDISGFCREFPAVAGSLKKYDPPRIRLSELASVARRV